MIDQKFQLHVWKECAYRVIKCPKANKGCRHSCCVKDLYAHLLECIYINGSKNKTSNKKNKKGKKKKKEKKNKKNKKDKEEKEEKDKLNPFEKKKTSKFKTKVMAVSKFIVQAASNITMGCTFEGCNYLGKMTDVLLHHSQGT